MRVTRIFSLGLLAWGQILFAQNVGIGTAAPANRLHIDGPPATDASATGGAQLRISENQNNYFMLLGRTTGTNGYGFIQTHNNQPLALNPLQNPVGIGTTAPQGRLGIRGGWENWIALQDAINSNIYVFHNPSSGDRLEIGVYHAAANTWRWGRMVFRQEGNIGINTTTPHPRAILDITSNTQGLLIPRLTTAQRDAIPDPIPQGLIIYNTDVNCIEFFDTSADPPGGPTGGFWNSLCLYCDYTVYVNANATGFNLRDHIISQGIPLGAYTYCVYVGAVTLQAAGNGGGSGAPGNPGFNASTMPNGARVILYNYGTILAGGGNGGRGGRESDSACEGDMDGAAGGRGGDAILTNANVPIFVYNYGTLRAGGGGGGGGRGGCCSAGGGGGGGAGTPPGSGGPGNSYRCVGGTVCPCSGRTGSSSAGSGGTATSGGAGGASSGCSGSSNCPGTSNGCGSPGGAGGTNGAAGAPGSTANPCCGSGCVAGAGGGPGYAINGNGSGARLIVNTGTIVGAIIP